MKKRGFSTIMDIILILIIFFIIINLFFGGGGWFTKGLAGIASILGMYSDIDNDDISNSNYSSSINTRSFYDNFNKLIYSNSERCYKIIPIPKEIKEKELKYIFDQNDGYVSIYLSPKDTEEDYSVQYQDMYSYDLLKETDYNFKMCVVIDDDSDSADRFEENMDCMSQCKEPNDKCLNKCNKKDYYDNINTIELFYDGFMSGGAYQFKTNIDEDYDFDNFLFYKPDKKHICLVYDDIDLDDVKNTYSECADGNAPIDLIPALTVLNMDCKDKEHNFKTGFMETLISYLKGYKIDNTFSAYDLINDLEDNDLSINPRNIVLSIMLCESRGDKCAIGKNEKRNGKITYDVGIMQINDGTLKDYLGKTLCSKSKKICRKISRNPDSRYDVAASILLGYRIFIDKYKKIKGDLPSGLSKEDKFRLTDGAYNGGEGTIKNAVGSCKNYNCVYNNVHISSVKKHINEVYKNYINLNYLIS